MNTRMKGSLILVFLAAAYGAGCSESDAFGPESSLGYGIQVNPSVVNPGDLAYIGISVGLTFGAERADVLIRGFCAENVEVYRGKDLVATLPSPATCPDSVYA